MPLYVRLEYICSLQPKISHFIGKLSLFRSDFIGVFYAFIHCFQLFVLNVLFIHVIVSEKFFLQSKLLQHR